MELRNKLSLILLLSVCSVSCFPSRPLNDRPSELTWQAWLLVDSQNQLQNESDRRITPKSVFIAPKLGQRNDTLPECADGYRADSMGRCIKFVKVDEDAQLQFFLNRLNEKFATHSWEEIEESEESAPTAGPLQVNIPLGQTDEDEEEEIVGGPILAPTNGQFDDKLDVKRHPDTAIINKPVEVPVPPPNEDYDYADEVIEENTEENETEKQTEPTTTEITTVETTTASTTEESTGTTEFLTTTSLPNADDGLKALFFLMPTNTTQKKDTSETTTPPNTTPEATTTPPTEKVLFLSKDVQADSQHVVESIAPYTPQEPETSSNIRFPEQHFIKFPVIEELNLNHRDEYPVRPNLGQMIGGPLHQRPSSINPDQRPLHQRPTTELTPEQIQEIFKQYVQRQAIYAEQPQIPHERVYNHRNRDKHEDLWSLTPSFREDPQHLRRFSRYPAPYYPPQGYYNSQHQIPHHQIEYFGDETGQDYSNTYGRKRRRENLR